MSDADAVSRRSSAARLRKLGRSYVATVRDRGITFLAAGFTYYAFLGLVPLLTLALVVTSVVDAALRQAVFAQIEAVSPQIARLLRQAVGRSARHAEVGIVGLLFLIWSATRFFRGLARAFDRVYDAPQDESFFDRIEDALIVMATLGLGAALVGAAVAVSQGLVLAVLPYSRVVGFVGLLAGLTALLLPVYYVMPPIPVSVRDVLPGVALAAIGLTALQAVFVLGIVSAGQYGTYGKLGGVLFFLLWLHLAGIVLLAGVTLNVVLERDSPESEFYPPR